MKSQVTPGFFICSPRRLLIILQSAAAWQWYIPVYSKAK
jgi:hypothetical protein